MKRRLTPNWLLLWLIMMTICIKGQGIPVQIPFLEEDTLKTFHVLGFFTAKEDKAHISFVHEANRWFAQQSLTHHFSYDSTNNWNLLNDSILSKYQVVIFLDTRPEEIAQRIAFEKYVKNGGGWLGFHFSAFALENSSYPNNWAWYNDEFLACGQYRSNTWRPTSAILKVESNHPTTKDLPKKFRSQPNEWYRWEHDLTQNKNIKILLSIDPSSFPLGTGPKPSEIWHEGYYPIAWTNINYKMVYINMGHNDIDYEHLYDDSNKTLSYSLKNEIQERFILNCVEWLGNR